MGTLAERMAWAEGIGKVIVPREDHFECLENLLKKNNIPTHIEISLSDRSEPRLAQWLVQMASTVTKASELLGVDVGHFKSRFDHDLSDHEDNCHRIDFLPTLTAGNFATLHLQGEVFPVLILTFAFAGEIFNGAPLIENCFIVNRLNPVTGKMAQKQQVFADVICANQTWLTPLAFSKFGVIDE